MKTINFDDTINLLNQMSVKKVFIADTEVEYNELVKFLLSKSKMQAIHFLKTKNKLDIRDAKHVVEIIRAGKLEEGYQLLTEHLDCGSPIIEKSGEINYENPTHKNPFLIEEPKVSRRGVLLIVILLIAIAIAMLLSRTP